MNKGTNGTKPTTQAGKVYGTFIKKGKKTMERICLYFILLDSVITVELSRVHKKETLIISFEPLLMATSADVSMTFWKQNHWN